MAMTRFRAWSFLLLILALMAPSGAAHAWWNKDWTLRAKVTADAGPAAANITEPIGRTQILVRLHAGNFDFSGTKLDGADLRFIASDDKTPLHYHIEKFDQKDQVALVWVDLPDMAPGTASPFWLYWGNPNASDGGDAKGTFDPDTLLVYHFTEENGLPKDTTGFGSNALTAGTRDEAGIVGFGLRLDGEKPLLRIAKAPHLAITEAQPLTVSMWIQPGPAAMTSVLFSDREGGNGLTIGLDQGVPYAQVDGPAGSRKTSGGAALSGTGWHQITAVLADNKMTVFVDGQAQGTGTATLPAINGQPVIGGGEAPNTPRFIGLIDEFRIAKVARQPGAIQASVASEGPDGKLLSFDTAEQGSANTPGFVVIIFRSVTFDAWVVIVILVIMSILSWYVMISKSRYLSRQSRANKLFKDEYRKLVIASDGDHMAALAGMAEREDGALRASSMHRLSKIAIEELRERQATGKFPAGGLLSSQSLHAIQAAIETGVVHEQHRLNHLIVVLTISISGGPFIGLLGTVVGVMITFAAIAAAGDVNVNAIAPGIAAALLATCAGMFVAIPAMFGYNILLLRIRDAGAEMTTFVNETITRMGEARAPGRPAAAAGPTRAAMAEPPPRPSRVETPPPAPAVAEPPARPPVRPAARLPGRAAPAAPAAAPARPPRALPPRTPPVRE